MEQWDRGSDCTIGYNYDEHSSKYRSLWESIMESLMLLSQIKQEEALQLRPQGFGKALAFLWRGDADEITENFRWREKKGSLDGSLTRLNG